MLRKLVSKPCTTFAKKVLSTPSIGGRRGIHTTKCVCGKELTPFQLEKITTEYDHMYDRNGDGFVDKEDIEIFKRKLRTYMEQVRGHALRDSGYKAAYDDYWTLMHDISDTNRDGKLSREEWITTWADVNARAKDISFRSLPQWVQIMPASIFPVIDTKGDGVIDKEEYKNFWFHVGGFPSLEADRLDHVFNVLTENGTSSLDVLRIQELYADFYLSDDPSSPGRYIAGPMDFE